VASLPRQVSRDGVVRPDDYQTPVKTRILAGGIHSAKQQVVRIDRRTGGERPPIGRTWNARCAPLSGRRTPCSSPTTASAW
jgi:hypothetical protein